jgi:hypothetical protein
MKGRFAFRLAKGKGERKHMGFTTVRVATALVVAAMLAVFGLASARAGQVSGDSYVSPTYGYSISWNAEFWTVANESSEDGVDSLVLQLGDGVGNFFLTGLPASQEPEDCLAAIASGRAESGDYPGYGQVSGRATPAVGPGGAGALFGYTLVTQSGDEIPLVQWVECRTLVPGEALLLITLEVIDEPSLYEAALVLYDELIGSLRLPGGTQVEDEPEDEPSDEPEDEPADEPEDEPEDEDDRGPQPSGSGVEGNVYTSPNFGYTITWDPGVWQVTDESYEDGGDYFEVTTLGGTSIVSFIAVEGYGGDASLCRDDANAILGETEGITAFTPTPHVDTGEPLIGGDSALAFAIFDVTFTDESGTLQARSYLQCRTLVEGRAVLALIWIVPTQLFNTDLAAFEGLLAGIDTSEAAVLAGGGTSAADEEEDSEGGADDEAGGGDEDEEVPPDDEPEPEPEPDDEAETEEDEESERENDESNDGESRHGQEV